MASSPRSGASQPDESSRILDRGYWLVLVMGVVCIALVVVSMTASAMSPGPGRRAAGAASSAAASASPSGPVQLAVYLLPATPAPRIQLTDQDARPFSLAAFRGGDTFVFFGYTHCADVCPATIGRVGEALAALGSGERAVFVTVDPERDTTTWLNEFVRYMPKGFSAVTGTDSEIAATAADWGVRYAREETGVDGAYTMSHTADVYLVDRAGMLRARFPFGTESDVMTAVAREVASTAAAAAPASPAASSATPTATPTSGAPSTATSSSPPATARPETPFGVEVISSSIWSGPRGPSSSRCP